MIKCWMFCKSRKASKECISASKRRCMKDKSTQGRNVRHRWKFLWVLWSDKTHITGLGISDGHIKCPWFGCSYCVPSTLGSEAGK